jgi:hypothetical protein
VRTTLAIPYADVDAGSLTWRVGLAPVPAVGRREVALAGGTVDLRLLGASHQVIVRSGAATYSEVVACRPGGSALPRHVRGETGGLRYEFRAEVSRPGDLAGAVAAVLAEVADRPGGLVGAYPGSPLAVTALLAEPARAGVRWRSWHAYPQTGELVLTETVLGA